MHPSTTLAIERYHVVSRLLHWLMAAILIVAIPIVIFRDPIEEATGWMSMSLHKSLGISIFAISILRLVWRLFNRPPAIAGTPLARALAHGAHMGMYALMLILPTLGYIMSSASPRPMMWFGLELPKLPVTRDSLVTELAGQGHVIGGYLIVALILGHIGAALWHHFVLRDTTLSRMLPTAR